MSHRRSYITSAFLACILMLVLSLGIATPAYAREYEMTRTDIDATVGTDGSMEVREERIFDFDGQFNGVYWNLPQGEFQGRYVTVDILEAGEIVNGEVVSYDLSNSGDNLTYSIESYGSSLRLKIYARHSDEDAHFFIVYRLNDVASRHADVGELYWQFVTEGWDQESHNVTCTVHLPVPSGEAVTPEGNVRAWGHGPIDAEVRFRGNDIVYDVPGVGSSEFAEARVTFPASWLPDAQQDRTEALPGILAQEQEWADAANRERMFAKVAYFGTMGIAAIASVGTAVFAFFKRKAYEEATKPQFDDDYFRDVPTDDHPAVLGALYKGGTIEPEQFTATLMNLTSNGVIALQHVKMKVDGLFGSKVEDDYRLVYNNKPIMNKPNPTHAQRAAERIDHAAFDLMFRKVALGMTDEHYDKGTYPPMYFSNIKEYAEDHPSTYESAYESWESAVRSEYSARFKSGPTVVKFSPVGLGILGILDLALAVIFFVMAIFFDMPFGLLFLFTALLIISGINAIIVAFSGDASNAEGREVKAKLEALKRWLKDFTRLNEAIPTDVVLWNRLLVIAVVLGVAEEVIRQLETVLPEVLHSDYMSTTYGWYYVSSSSRLSPASTVSSVVSSSHYVSTSDAAGSSWSSGGGGGGGFSSGGGGGFGGGGGGGGGAF